jgi:4'-phosphopantetheinyl transferase EntD
VDAELAVPIDAQIMHTILSEDERRHLDIMPKLAATAIFSAKEAVYKGLSPQLDEIWGFDAMCIRLRPEANQFEATVFRDVGRLKCGDTLLGLLLWDETHIVTAFVQRAADQVAD